MGLCKSCLCHLASPAGTMIFCGDACGLRPHASPQKIVWGRWYLHRKLCGVAGTSTTNHLGRLALAPLLLAICVGPWWAMMVRELRAREGVCYSGAILQQTVIFVKWLGRLIQGTLLQCCSEV